MIPEWQKDDIAKLLQEIDSDITKERRKILAAKCEREFRASVMQFHAHLKLADKHHKRALTWYRRYVIITGKAVQL